MLFILVVFSIQGEWRQILKDQHEFNSLNLNY